MQVRQPAHVRALAQRRKRRRTHHLPRDGGRMHVRSDDAERPAFEHAGDMVPACWREPHERRDAGFERGHADRRAGLERELDARPRRACRNRRCWRCARFPACARAAPSSRPPPRRARFSLTLLRRMSPIRTARPPRSVPLAASFAIPWPYRTRWRYAADVRQGIPSRSSTETIHELTTDFKSIRGQVSAEEWQRVDRRLLPPGRPIRHDRPHLQPHHGAHSRARTTCSSTSTACSTRRSRHRAW